MSFSEDIAYLRQSKDVELGVSKTAFGSIYMYSQLP